MNERITHEAVEIRRAKEADRDAIIRIASQTWDGYDYLPEFLDEWLSHPDGAFNVMLYRGKVVALGKITRLDDGEWWLEGLRVDPELRGRGLARIMHHYIIAQARQIADGEIRFSTGSNNHPIIKLAAETGFQQISRFSIFSADASSSSTDSLRQLTVSELNTTYRWLESSVVFQDANRSFEHRWKWKIANQSYLGQLLDEGRVYGWYPDGASGDLAGVLVTNPLRYSSDNEPILGFGFGDARPELRTQFWRAAKGLAANLGGTTARVKMVDKSEYTQPLVDAGWEASKPKPVLFSRPIILTEKSEVRFEETPALEPDGFHRREKR